MTRSSKIDAKFQGISGMPEVIKNLNREINKIENYSMAGLMEVTTFIRQDMEITPPLIPIDTGNLRASWFVTPRRLLGRIGVIMGFNANYAIYVHERVDGAPWGAGVVDKVNWKRPNSGPKFFEAAIKRNVSNILKIIKKHVKIP